jgi:membrane protein DedA with SNARE-associated domain
MTDLLQPLLDWIRANPEHAGWVVFAMALAESLAIVGMLIPGVVILVGAGTLIGAGLLNFWEMFAWAVAGAVIGDGLSYWLGHHFEYLTARFRWFRLHPDHMAKGVRFFEKYGDLSVAVGRFFGPIRAVVPLVAGLLHMPPARFYMANILSALVWAPAYLAPGILLGEAAKDGGLKALLWPAIGLGLVLMVLLVAHQFSSRRR